MVTLAFCAAYLSSDIWVIYTKECHYTFYTINCVVTLINIDKPNNYFMVKCKSRYVTCVRSFHTWVKWIYRDCHNKGYSLWNNDKNGQALKKKTFLGDQYWRKCSCHKVAFLHVARKKSRIYHFDECIILIKIDQNCLLLKIAYDPPPTHPLQNNSGQG